MKIVNIEGTIEEIEEQFKKEFEDQEHKFNTPEWKKVVKLSKRIRKIENGFEKRKWLRKHSNIWPLRPIQNTLDSMIVYGLKILVPKYNDALDAYRCENGASPVPKYKLSEVTADSKRYLNNARLNYTAELNKIGFRNTRSIPLVNFKKIIPKDRNNIIISEITHSDDDILCGYCGGNIKIGINSDRKYFEIPNKSYFGTSASNYCCGKDDCKEIGILTFVRSQLSSLQIQEMMNSIGRKILSNSQNINVEEEKTRSVYNKGYNQIFKKLNRNIVE